MDEQLPAVEPFADDDADRSAPDDMGRSAADTTPREGPRRGRDQGPASVERALGWISTAEDRAAAALDRAESALDRHDAAEQLESSYRDDLTGALSRAAGRDQLGAAIDRAHRMANHWS